MAFFLPSLSGYFSPKRGRPRVLKLKIPNSSFDTWWERKVLEIARKFVRKLFIFFLPGVRTPFSFLLLIWLLISQQGLSQGSEICGAKCVCCSQNVMVAPFFLSFFLACYFCPTRDCLRVLKLCMGLNSQNKGGEGVKPDMCAKGQMCADPGVMIPVCRLVKN